MSKLVRPVGAVAFLCLFFAIDLVQAAAGDWDHSFGTDGRVSLTVPGIEFTVAKWEPQPDGKIVAVGHLIDPSNGFETQQYVVARLHADGSPDTAFDGDGVRTFSFASPFVGTIEIERQPDGKLLIVAQAGNGGHHPRLLRLNADGSPDASFGSGGELELRYARFADNPQLTLAANGSIFVTSRLGDWLTQPTVVVTRVTSGGAIDASYGTGGSVVIDSPDGHLDAFAVVAVQNGAIALGGKHGQLNEGAPFVALITPQGQRDASFGTNGVAVLPFLGGDAHINAIDVSAGGMILVAGELPDSSGVTRPFVARLTASGALDPTFGSQGRIVVLGDPRAIAAQSDGKVVVAGTVSELADSFGWLARFNSDGSPDVTFGQRGSSSTDFSVGELPSSSELSDLARNADGSYSALVRIYTRSGNRTSFAVARFLATGTSAGAIGVYSSSEAAEGTRLIEANRSVQSDVYRTGGADGVATVQYRVVGQTATAGTDFVAATGTITFNDGEVGSKTVAFQLLDDGVRENAERLYLEIFSPTAAVLSKSRAVFEIAADQDVGTTVAFVDSTEHALERAGNVTLLVRRTGDLRDPLTVTYAPVAGTASAGADFSGAAGTITWSANQGDLRTITIPIVNDGTAEPEEQFTVVLSVPDGTPSSQTATVTISDDDGTGQPQLGFATSAIVVTEGASAAMLQVMRIGDLSQAVSAQWTTALNASTSTATNGQDYTASSGTLDWAAGDSTPRTVVIPLLNDAVSEPLEFVGVNVVAVSPAANFDGGFAAVRIVDDEAVPSQVTINLGAGSNVVESVGTVLLPVTLSGVPADTVSVSYSVNAQTASGADVRISSGDRTWLAGDTSDKSITISITNDTLDEIDETFTVNLFQPQGGAVIGAASATFTILDDDPTPPGQPGPIPPGVRFVPATLTVNEGQHLVRLQIERVGDTSGSLSAICGATVGTTASVPSDYISPSRIIRWDPDETATQTIDIHINGDAVAEPDETIVTRCSPRAESVQLPPSVATTTIFDDDGAGGTPARIGWLNVTESVDEVATSVTLQVARAGNTSLASSVDYVVAVGSASTADVVVSSGTLTWAAIDASLKSITVGLLPDTVDEPDETFTVTLSNASSGTEIETAVTTVTIRDDDSPSASGPGGNPGGGGGGSEHPFILLFYACLIALSRMSARRPCRRYANTAWPWTCNEVSTRYKDDP